MPMEVVNVSPDEQPTIPTQDDLISEARILMLKSKITLRIRQSQKDRTMSTRDPNPPAKREVSTQVKDPLPLKKNPNYLNAKSSQN